MRRRWWLAAIAALTVASALAFVWYRLPALVGRHVERTLAAQGFPGAHVRVASLGLHHLTLADVTLGEGLALGTVELDAGISLLLRPRVHTITLRGARLSDDAVARLARLGGGAWPFEVVRVVDGELTVRGVALAVSGAATLAGPAVTLDAEARAPRLALGSVELRELRATVHVRERELRACVTGRLADAAVEACTTLPSALPALAGLRTLDATVRADAPRWQLRGGGTLDWSRGLVLRDGHVDLRAPAWTAGEVTLHGAWISAQVSGDLATRVLELRGDARADRLELRSPETAADAASLHVPLAARLAVLDGALRVTPREATVLAARRATVRCADTTVELTEPRVTAFAANRPIELDAGLPVPRQLAWSAPRARLGTARFRAVSGTLIASRTLRWRAAEAAWRGARFHAVSGMFELAAGRHTTRWAAIDGPGPLALGAGELGFHCTRGRWTFDRGRTRALGGELALDPATASGSAIDLVVRAEGLALQRLLGSFTHGQADGTGVVDGELAVRLDGERTTLQRATLRARPGGRLRLSDAAWRARAAAAASGSSLSLALHHRIAATLADFTYAQLALVLHPEGANPELQITTRGRGKRIAQDITLTINLRGVRDAATRISFASPPRSQP